MTKLIYIIFCVTFFLDGMDAYSIKSVPAPWIAKLIIIVIFLSVLPFVRKELKILLPQKILIYAVIWSVIITLIGSLSFDYTSIFPSGSTTPYSIYLMLRFITLLSFLAFTILTSLLLRHGYSDNIIKFLVYFGAMISIFGIYTYFMQSYDLWEPIRTRIGTSGASQSIAFTDVDPSNFYNRALGSFREPALLAAWLVVPFFLSFEKNSLSFWMARITMAIAILFTASLGVISSIMLSIFLLSSIIFISFIRKNKYKLANYFKTFFMRFFLIFIILLIVAFIMKSDTFHKKNEQPSYTKNSFDNILIHRIQNIFLHGLANSNRNYIYDYIRNSEISWLGRGLGNANIYFNQYLSKKYPPNYFGENSFKLPSSILSLYFNFYYASGIIGSFLFLIFLMLPLGVFFKKLLIDKQLDRSSLLICFGYLTWLIIFSFQAEELTLMFGVAFIFLTYKFFPYAMLFRTSVPSQKRDVMIIF